MVVRRSASRLRQDVDEAEARSTAAPGPWPHDLMNERDFFDERQETKRATYSCPHCRERGEYQVRWLRRTKKAQPPRGMNEQQRAQFRNARDYMVRMDDMLVCARCRKRFDIPNFQSVVFI